MEWQALKMHDYVSVTTYVPVVPSQTQYSNVLPYIIAERIQKLFQSILMSGHFCNFVCYDFVFTLLQNRYVIRELYSVLP